MTRNSGRTVKTTTKNSVGKTSKYGNAAVPNRDRRTLWVEVEFDVISIWELRQEFVGLLLRVVERGLGVGFACQDRLHRIAQDFLHLGVIMR
ncbi:MAG: hypothetical protein HDKAJFGB_04206 [Anaerolineae bacterium]|nr:hypothetical protein [Anaerolineae bacterium]